MSTKQFIVARCLLSNSRFAKSVLPHLKEDYFQGQEYKFLFKVFDEHVRKYHAVPDPDAIIMHAEEDPRLSEDVGTALVSLLDEIKANPIAIDGANEQWAFNTTESWCVDRATRLALEEGIKIDAGKSDKKTQQILELMKAAASISFDRRVGHDYLRDFDERFNFYHTTLDRVPTGIEVLDRITGGGFPKKTLNVFQAGTNVGKTMMKCAIAANMLKAGRNVLYITHEDGEYKIGKRIDANLLDVSLDDIESMSEQEYDRRMNALAKRTGMGRLIIREYPAASVSVLHYDNLLEDLYLKEGFKADVVCVDYLNLVLSARVKAGNNMGMYNVIKSVAEELRGFAQKHDLVLLTSTQTNRAGFTKTELGLEDSSESFGVPMTADWFVSLVTDEELDKKNLWVCYHNKSRYADKSKEPKFFLSVNRLMQRVTDANPMYTDPSLVNAIPDMDFDEGDGDDISWG